MFYISDLRKMATGRDNVYYIKEAYEALQHGKQEETPYQGLDKHTLYEDIAIELGDKFKPPQYAPGNGLFRLLFWGFS